MDCVILETPRLRLRTWQDEDVDKTAPIYEKPEVMRYIPGGVWTHERTARIVERMRELDARDGYGFYPLVLKSTGRVIGHCGLGHLEAGEEVEVAYVLDSDCWGCGYATESVVALLEYAFEALPLERIVAVAMPDNPKSIAVMRRAQMQPVGEATHFGMTVMKYEKRKGA